MDPININRLGHVQQQEYLEAAEQDRQGTPVWTLRGIVARVLTTRPEVTPKTGAKQQKPEFEVYATER